MGLNDFKPHTAEEQSEYDSWLLFDSVLNEFIIGCDDEVINLDKIFEYAFRSGWRAHDESI